MSSYLSETDVQALRVLSDPPMPVSVADFGMAMGYRQRAGSRNNLTGARVLSRLRERGLVAHAPDPNAGGRYRWRITSLGDIRLKEALEGRR